MRRLVASPCIAVLALVLIGAVGSAIAAPARHSGSDDNDSDYVHCQGDIGPSDPKIGLVSGSSSCSPVTGQYPFELAQVMPEVGWQTYPLEIEVGLTQSPSHPWAVYVGQIAPQDNVRFLFERQMCTAASKVEWAPAGKQSIRIQTSSPYAGAIIFVMVVNGDPAGQSTIGYNMTINEVQTNGQQYRLEKVGCGENFELMLRPTPTASPTRDIPEPQATALIHYSTDAGDGSTRADKGRGASTTFTYLTQSSGIGRTWVERDNTVQTHYPNGKGWINQFVEAQFKLYCLESCDYVQFLPTSLPPPGPMPQSSTTPTGAPSSTSTPPSNFPSATFTQPTQTPQPVGTVSVVSMAVRVGTGQFLYKHPMPVTQSRQTVVDVEPYFLYEHQKPGRVKRTKALVGNAHRQTFPVTEGTMGSMFWEVGANVVTLDAWLIDPKNPYVLDMMKCWEAEPTEACLFGWWHVGMILDEERWAVPLRSIAPNAFFGDGPNLLKMTDTHTYVVLSEQSGAVRAAGGMMLPAWVEFDPTLMGHFVSLAFGAVQSLVDTFHAFTFTVQEPAFVSPVFDMGHFPRNWSPESFDPDPAIDYCGPNHFYSPERCR